MRLDTELADYEKTYYKSKKEMQVDAAKSARLRGKKSEMDFVAWQKRWNQRKDTDLLDIRLPGSFGRKEEKYNHIK